ARSRQTSCARDWSSDVRSSDLEHRRQARARGRPMNPTAERVFTRPEDIEHLRGQIEQLCEGAFVRLTLRDGGVQQGTVSARPQADRKSGGEGERGAARGGRVGG